MKSLPLFGRLSARVWTILILLPATAALHAQSTGLVVTSNNNVGIGTTNPVKTLTVNGTAAVLAGNAMGFYDSGNADYAYILNPGTNAATQGLKYYAAGTGGHLFQTYNGTVVNALQILNNGKVGIGTTSPDGKLEVVGPNADAGNGNEGIRVSATGTGDRLDIGTNGSSRYSWLRAQRNGVGENNLILQEYGGYVGIGTTSPGSLLDIGGTNNKLFLQNSGATSGYAYGMIQNSGGNLLLGVAGSNGSFWNSGNGGAYFATLGTTTATALTLATNNAGRMTIDSSGNVGVGTASPNYRLDVNGSVHANSFITPANTYADFVFKPDYKLEPLSQVEATIKQDGHLSGIPSEEEAKVHGIDLAQMQVKLLQKIEELTLYQIEQQKLLEDQSKRLDEQAQQIVDLKKENTELRAGLTK